MVPGVVLALFGRNISLSCPPPAGDRRQIYPPKKAVRMAVEAPPAGSVSRLVCAVSVGGKGGGRIAMYRHLAPLTVNAVARSLPLSSRVTLQPAMVSLFTQLRIGVEKPRMKFARGDVAFLPSGGLICVFLGEAKSDRPLNPIGQVESGVELFDALKSGDVVNLSAPV